MQIPEDDPVSYKHAVAVLTMKLFADLERRRRELENRISSDAAKTREAQLQAEEKKNVEKEFTKNWEESRQGRVNSWLNFTGKPVHNSKKSPPSSNTILPDSASHSVVGASSLKQGLPHANVISSGQGNARGSSNTHTPYTQQHSSMYGAQNTYAQHPSGNSYAQGYQAATNNTSSQVDKKPKKKKEKRFSPMGFRPPKHKPETRD